MEIILAAAIGIIFGFMFAVIILHNDSLGTLRVETSDPDGPYLFLELNTDIKNICSKKYANLQVKVTDSSQK